MKDNYKSCPPFTEMRFGNGDIIVAVPGKEVFHVLYSGGNRVLVIERDRTKLLGPNSDPTDFFTMSVHEAADKGYLAYKTRGVDEHRPRKRGPIAR